jgi:hypothetical protein
MKAPLESLVLTSIVAKLHHFSKPSTASEPVVQRPGVRGTRIGFDGLSRRAKRVKRAAQRVKLEGASPGLIRLKGLREPDQKGF